MFIPHQSLFFIFVVTNCRENIKGMDLLVLLTDIESFHQAAFLFQLLALSIVFASGNLSRETHALLLSLLHAHVLSWHKNHSLFGACDVQIRGDGIGSGRCYRSRSVDILFSEAEEQIPFGCHYVVQRSSFVFVHFFIGDTEEWTDGKREQKEIHACAADGGASDLPLLG